MNQDYAFVADPDSRLCNRMVLDHHYSHLVPTAVVYRAGLIDSAGDLAAVVMFSVPSTRWGEPVRELARLVRLPNHKPPLTSLIGKACKELRKRGLADLVVSFADSTQGHHGGVYQASSWSYHEMRKPQNDGFIVNGEFIHRRVCNHRYGTSSRRHLAHFFRFMGMTFEEHWDTGKHLYWRSLTHKGDMQAKSLGLKTMPYFKDRLS